MRIVRSLEDAVTCNKTIMESEKNSPKARMESSRIVEKAERHLYELSKYMDR